MSVLRSLGPAVAQAPVREALRAGLGALIGLGVTEFLALNPAVNSHLGLYLVAPFGATSVLLFAVPNSPLAQPWSAVVGNVVAAIVGVAVCMSVPDPVGRVALAVGLAITAMILCRAVHPPAGAVAMVAAMSPDTVHEMGFWFALSPIASGTVILVGIAALYAKLTGRRYPFRQFDAPNSQGTQDSVPAERLGLSEAELTEILARHRQSFNLGTEDLARLIGAAELQAAAHRTGPLVAADIMSRNLVTALPDMSLSEVAELFRRHRFTSLPVTDKEAGFLGVIFQIHLIMRAGEIARAEHSSFASSLGRLVHKRGVGCLSASDLMSVTTPHVSFETPLAALLPMMAEGSVDAVPVLDGPRLVGIVTRTDLIAALARSVGRSG